MATHFTLESSDRNDDDHYVRLEVSGDGDLEHYIEAFTSFLLAHGFHPDTVADLLPTVEDIDNRREAALAKLGMEMGLDQHDYGDGDERELR